MRISRTLTTAVAALAVAGLSTAAANADAGRKLDLTTDAAVAADDTFGAVADDDATGQLALAINPGREQVCVTGTFEGDFDTEVTPNAVDALHIHVKSDADGDDNPQTGPVVVQLSPTLTDGGLAADGCVDVDRDDLRRIITDRDAYYVNAHDVIELDEDGDPAVLPVIRAELQR